MKSGPSTEKSDLYFTLRLTGYSPGVEATQSEVKFFGVVKVSLIR